MAWVSWRKNIMASTIWTTIWKYHSLGNVVALNIGDFLSPANSKPINVIPMRWLFSNLYGYVDCLNIPVVGQGQLITYKSWSRAFDKVLRHTQVRFQLHLALFSIRVTLPSSSHDQVSLPLEAYMVWTSFCWALPFGFTDIFMSHNTSLHIFQFIYAAFTLRDLCFHAFCILHASPLGRYILEMMHHLKIFPLPVKSSKRYTELQLCRPGKELCQTSQVKSTYFITYILL